jgi:hypothetical protein
MPSFFNNMKSPLQAHSANSKTNKNHNSNLRKELAKIKLINIKKVSKAHLQHKPEAANEPIYSQKMMNRYYLE